MPILISIQQVGNDVYVNATCSVDTTKFSGLFNNETTNTLNNLKFNPHNPTLLFAPLGDPLVGDSYVVENMWSWKCCNIIGNAASSGCTNSFYPEPTYMTYNQPWGIYFDPASIKPYKIVLPQGYVSNTLLTAQMIFTNTNLGFGSPTLYNLGLIGGGGGTASGFKAGFSWGPNKNDFDYCSVVVGSGGFAFANGSNYQITVANNPSNGNLIEATGIGYLWSGPYTDNQNILSEPASIVPSLGRFNFHSGVLSETPYYFTSAPQSLQVSPPIVTGGTFQGTANPFLTIDSLGFYKPSNSPNWNTRYQWCPAIVNYAQKIVFNTQVIEDLGMTNGVYTFSGVNNIATVFIDAFNVTPTPTTTPTNTLTPSPTSTYDCILINSECGNIQVAAGALVNGKPTYSWTFP